MLVRFATIVAIVFGGLLGAQGRLSCSDGAACGGCVIAVDDAPGCCRAERVASQPASCCGDLASAVSPSSACESAGRCPGMPTDCAACPFCRGPTRTPVPTAPRDGRTVHEVFESVPRLVEAMRFTPTVPMLDRFADRRFSSDPAMLGDAPRRLAWLCVWTT